VSTYSKHGQPIPLSQWHPEVLKVEQTRQEIQNTTNILAILLGASLLVAAGLVSLGHFLYTLIGNHPS
jgi:hypothetical protein